MTIGTKHPSLFAALAAPFAEGEVKVKPGQGGRTIHYITARTAMNRLDAVVGPEMWWDEYLPMEHSVICKLTIRLPDGSTVTKWDAGGNAGMADEGDDDKSGFSDAFKRACAKWLVGRYLYRDGVPHFGPAREPGSDDDTPPVHAPAPAPAPRARPASNDSRDFPPSEPARNGNGNGNGQQRQYDDRPPTTGRQLFAWLKKQDEQHNAGLLKLVNEYLKGQQNDARIVDLDEEWTAAAYAEANRKLAAAH